MVSKGITIAGQSLSVDPRSGKLERLAKPFPKDAANRIAPDHTVTVNRANGTAEIVTIVGASYADLRDANLIAAIATGDWDEYLSGRRVTNEQWRSYVHTLALKHPDLVKTADTVKPVINDDGEFVA